MAKADTQQHGVAGAFCNRMIQVLDESKKHLSDHSAAGALARGKVFALAAELTRAIDSYAEALSLDNKLSEATARLALVQIRAGHPEKALHNAMTLAAREPNFLLQELSSNERISAMTVLGEALLANGRVDDALHAYKTAREISDKDSYAAGRLAQLSIATGKASEAAKLSGQFATNPRACFQDLNAVMALGSTNVALLPTMKVESLVAKIALCMPGRPILADGAPRVAPVVWGDDSWCADRLDDCAQ
jgi:tetratricopeptide (TPR) repeat protein